LQARASESYSGTQVSQFLYLRKRREFSRSLRYARHKHRLRARALRIVFGYGLRQLCLATVDRQLVIGTNKVAASYILSRKADHKSFVDKLTDSMSYQSTSDRIRIHAAVTRLMPQETLFNRVTVIGY